MASKRKPAKKPPSHKLRKDADKPADELKDEQLKDVAGGLLPAV